MRLSQFLAPEVSNRTRARGASYVVTGAVTHIERHDAIVQATVRGTEDYDVWIEHAGSTLRSSCTCPYFLDRLEICKHIWAVILLAEARGIPLLNPGPVPADIELLPVDIDDPADDWNDDEPWSPLDGLRMDALPRLAPPARRAPPPWQQALDSIAAVPVPPPMLRPRVEPGQLLYVLDIAASLAASVLVVELMTRDRKQSGEWGKPKAARVLRPHIPALPDGPDRHILERLMGAAPDYGHLGYSPVGEIARVRLHGGLVQELLPQMCADGRGFARMAAPTSDPAPPRGGAWALPPKPAASTLAPLQFDDGPPWCVEVAIHRDEAAAVYRIEGRLTRGDDRLSIADPLLVLDDGVLITPTHVARLDHRGAFAWLAALRRAGTLEVPFDARPALVDALLARPLQPIEAPPDLRFEIETGVPRPALRLTPGTWRDQLEATVTMTYGDLSVDASAPHPLIRTSDASRIVRRDLDAERAFVERLHGLGFRAQWSQRAQGQVLQLSSERLPRAVRTLLAEGWHVEASGVTYRRPGTARLAVTSGIDWFDVEGSVDYDGQSVTLPALLAASRRGDGFVTLDDGSYGLLPEDWLKTSGALARMGTPDGGRLRFRRSQASLLGAMLAAQPAVTCDEAFARARRELSSFDGIAPADPGPLFTGALRRYQREGLGWLLFLRRFDFGGCLADDMGLGKTVMLLALMARLRADGEPASRPSLIVAPRSLVFNWRQEASRFAPSLRVLEYTGAGRAGLRDAFAAHDLVLTTYGTLRRDATHLTDVAFDYVVLDEAQAIKNAASASAKAARLLRANHRLALSGTPIENHLGELWSLFEFLNPGVLGSAAAFDASTRGGRLDDDAVALLSRGLRPFILRRTKAQVAPELPPKTEQTVYCELERPQRTLYNELRDHYRQALLARVDGGGLGRAKLQVLEALLRLRQAACHPGLIDKTRAKEASAKLDVLVPRVLEAVAEGHKTLVFSQFTSLLALVRHALDAAGIAYEYLDGRTRDRERRVGRFQTDPECRLFLISLKAGGVGLNLTAAEYVFLLDPWWNPAVEAQAIDRTHRIGQSRHVFAYRLIAKDTVEERVLELQQQKRALADAILSADESLIRSLKREDLELLLS